MSMKLFERLQDLLNLAASEEAPDEDIADEIDEMLEQIYDMDEPTDAIEKQERSRIMDAYAPVSFYSKLETNVIAFRGPHTPVN